MAQLAAATVEPVMLTLLSVGLCVLLVWIVRRAANPRKLTLANTPGRPNTLNPAHVILILLLWYSAYLAIGRALRLFFAEDSPHLTVLLNLIVEGIMLAGALVVAAWTFRFGLRRGLGLTGRHWIYDTGRGVVGFLAVWPPCLALWWAFQWAAPQDHQQHVMLVALDLLPGGWQVLVVLTAALLAPMAEEVFFRGLMQSMIRRYTRLPWVAILISAAIFAFVHLPYWHHMPALFLLAIALGYNYERSGRLWAPILLHILFNGVNILLYVLARL